MGYHIYSTLSVDHVYGANAKYEKGKPNFKKKSVLIKGRANVIIPKSLETPVGACTSVSDEQFAIINEDPIFKMHVDGGYLKVMKQNQAVQKAVHDMEPKDASAQLTAADFKDSPNKPVVNASSDDDDDDDAGNPDTGKE